MLFYSVVGALSSAEAFLGGREAGEREKESPRVTMATEKRKREARGSHLFPLPIVPCVVTSF